MKRELIFLRAFAATTVLAIIFLSSSAFQQKGPQRFSEIDVERINIVESDGTAKLIITSAGRFPAGTDNINGRPTNADRKKRAGMLFFNEDGIECGGLIYDGKKNAKGHSAGLSLTYDQYDGDQVMQLLTEDYAENGQRMVTSSLMFNDRPGKESQQRTAEIMKELDVLRRTNPRAADEKYQAYEAQGLLGSTPRMMLGKSRSENNGLFLFDSKGMPRAMFYVDKNNQAKLDFFDDKGQLIASFPEKVK